MSRDLCAHKMADSDAQNRKRRILVALRELKCPFIKDYSEGVILDIIFTPGEQRLRILQWLVSMFDPKLQDIFSQPQRPEALVPKLSTALSWLGLCQPQDHELIKGTTHFSRQIVFMETLTEMVLVAKTLDDPFADTSMLQSEVEKSCYFIDALCQREDLKEVFPQQISLFTPDIMKACGLTTKHNTSLNISDLPSKSSQLQVPSLPQLMQQSELVAKQLEAEQENLAKLMKMQPPGGIDHSALLSQQKSIKMNLSTLNQVVGSFRHVYNEEIRPWTHKSPPVFSDLGPTFKKVHSYMEKITENLKTLDEVHRALDELEEMKPLRLKEMISQDPHYSRMVSILDEFLKTVDGQ